MLGGKKALSCQLPGAVQRFQVKLPGNVCHRRFQLFLVILDGRGELRGYAQQALDHGETAGEEAQGARGPAHGVGLGGQLLGIGVAAQLGGGILSQLLSVGGNGDGVGVRQLIHAGRQDTLGLFHVLAPQVYRPHQHPGKYFVIAARVQAQPGGRAQQKSGENSCDDAGDGKPFFRLSASLRLGNALAFHSSLLSQ